jgi:hypothetical protein
MAQALEKADQVTADEMRSVIEQLGSEIYGVGSFQKLQAMAASGGLADRPGAPYLIALLEMAA